MKYRVTHKTSYAGHEPVSIGHNQAWLEFRPVEHQFVESFSLTISPEPSVKTRRVDSFRNPVHAFSFNEGYQRLDVTATTLVTVRPPNTAPANCSAAWESIVATIKQHVQNDDRDAIEFLFASPRINWNADMRAYALQSFTESRPMMEAVRELTARIHHDFVYDSRATTVNTPVAEVFRLKRGVCQDFAHLQIAMLRSLGIPARYVSGYLRTVPPEGQPRLVGADASHAWLSVYCGSGHWADVDPTNDALCSTDHITLAWGRDYGDVPPLTGVFMGGGQHRLIVNVDVLPIG
ncbi:MAG: transglutaminase family protein [Planctomycetaceae bacterium]